MADPTSKRLSGVFPALLAWLLTFAATFVALGDPPPGPGFDADVAHKQLVVRVLMILAGLSTLTAIGLSIRAWPAKRAPNIVALLVAGAWVGSVLWMWSTY